MADSGGDQRKSRQDWDTFSTPFSVFINVPKQATFQGFVTLKYKLNRFSFDDASYCNAIKALLIPLSTRPVMLPLAMTVI